MFFQIVADLKKNLQHIYWKKSAYKGTQEVQTHVIQGSTVNKTEWTVKRNFTVVVFLRGMLLTLFQCSIFWLYK